MKVIRPVFRSRQKAYHTTDCYVAKSLKDRGSDKEADKELLDSWGWKECSRCSGEAKTGGKSGEQLSTKLHNTDPDEI